MHTHAHPPSMADAPDPKGGGARQQQKRLATVLSLTLGFMVVEAIGGVLSGSLALVADAGHMLTDSAAMLLSYLAIWLAGKEVTKRHTFGFRRAEFLAAFLNAIGLILLAIWIIFEAIDRIGSPGEIRWGLMLWVAMGGLLVNVLGIYLLHEHARDNLNLRSAMWHIAGDLLGSLGALVAALIIYLTGWMAIDPIVSIFIAGLIGAGGARILLDSAGLLMDKVPAEVDSSEISRFLETFPQVERICDLHIWGVSSTETMLTAHLVITPQINRDDFLHHLLQKLHDRFKLAHVTVQLESEPHASCPREW